ncbi:hypothetical protein IY145_24515 [Methylosinus sp. H3A]|nr:hypothetical protein [Methylosinus sp. H3A]
MNVRATGADDVAIHLPAARARRGTDGLDASVATRTNASLVGLPAYADDKRRMSDCFERFPFSALFETIVRFRLIRRAGGSTVCDADAGSSLFSGLSGGVACVSGGLAFGRGRNFTLRLLGGSRVAFRLLRLEDRFARGSVFRRAGFGGEAGGFAFFGSRLARGEDRLPGHQPLGRALVDLGRQGAKFFQLCFFRRLGGASALVKTGVLKNGHSLTSSLT